MKTLTKSELANLHFIADLMAGLTAVAVTIPVFLSIVLVRLDVSKAMRVTFILTAIFSGMVGCVSLLTLLVRGAGSARKYMRALSFGPLYLYCLLVLYMAGCVMFMAIQAAGVAGFASGLVVSFAVLAVACAIYVIFVTAKVPYMLSFLQDFQAYPKAQGTRLYQFIFSRQLESTRRKIRDAANKPVTITTDEVDEEQPMMANDSPKPGVM